MDKANLILNSTIELVDVQEEGNGKGRPFVSRFLEPGIAHYKELGDILITKETLNKFIHTMVGCPVIIEHEDVTDENADKLRVGVVSRVWFNEMDGYFYCEGILTDLEAIDLVKNQGYNVSCAYSFVSDNTKKTHNGKEIDMEFIDGEFLHLALVKDPRYEGANIVVNKNDEDIEWITVKGNHIPVKKGQSKDEAVKEFLEGKKETGSKDYKPGDKVKADTNWRGVNPKEIEGEIVEKRKSMAGHGDPNPNYEYLIKTKDGKTAWVDEEGILGHTSKDKSGERGKSFEELEQFDQERFMRELRGVYPVDAKDIHYEMPKLSQDDIQSILDKLEKEGRIVKKPIPYTQREGYTTQENIDFQEKRKKEKEQESTARKQASYDANKYEKLQKEYKDIKKHISQKQSAVDRASQQERLAEIQEELEAMEQNKPKGKSGDNKANNSIGDITMTVLNELKDFIKSVVSNEKEEEMKEVKNEDKRKLIDEVGGILKGKVDEELWRTVIGKLEKVAYKPSEDSKADNEDDEEKEAKNKCKNEEDEKEEEIEEKVTENEDEEDKKEDKEDKAENKKVKNSMKDIVMGGSSQAQTQKLYTSRKERLEEGNKY